MRIKKTAALALLLALTLCLCLSSCHKNPVIGLVAAYMGEDATTTDYTFTKDDFYVVASYEDGTFEQGVKDYEFEVVGLDEGYYILNFTYKGFTSESYVKCHVAVYPSEMGEGGN
ncbi:MAG: hypothetical protein II889_11590 [Clostridia bacterium]|nr:hypothetical protein [Clostridia bacterium]